MGKISFSNLLQIYNKLPKKLSNVIEDFLDKIPIIKLRNYSSINRERFIYKFPLE